ncbi:ATP-binding protein [Candidatus Pelagibacter bacterium]|nr:ATP-binding protein [Candidatus Pelagibacter bacterium]
MKICWKKLLTHSRKLHQKKINLFTEKDQNKIAIQRTPEIIYGLRNFIGNAVKFSKSEVKINLLSNQKIIEIKINDDGPGIPEDIIEKIGEPYIKSKSKEVISNSGLGLGTFLGKTLLERQNAKLSFRKNSQLGGALVIISWSPNNLINS